MDYLDWNDVLGREFFRAENAGRRVYLHVTTEVINAIGAERNSLDDFVAAVIAGPPGVTRRNLCQRALQASEDWRSDRRDFPPYIGYLGLFALAATIDGQFAPHAYYPRLNTLLNEDPHSGAPPSFDRMYELWSDLEQWSVVDMDGRLGIFAADIAGQWLHVGIPIAQTILTDRERSSLPAFFAASDFDPNTPPTDFELYQALRTHPPGTLRSRTLDLIAEDIDVNDACRTLVGLIGEELEEWDGIVPVADQSEGLRQAALRLCCNIDRVAGTASFVLRCGAIDGLPTGLLELSDPASGREFTCEPAAMGWSSPITELGTGELLDAASVDWVTGISLDCESPPLRWRLPGLRVRILTSGVTAGLPGWVEQRKLTLGVRLCILAHLDAVGVVETWGKTQCENFRPVRAKCGLSEAWRLYEADAATSDSFIRDEFPNVSLPRAMRLSLVGGIRTAPGSNQYFDFAPPRVNVLSNLGELAATPTCNDLSCLAGSVPGQFLLPDNLPHNEALRVGISSPDGSRVQRFLTLADKYSAASNELVNWRDRFGRLACDATPSSGRYSGALVDGAQGALETFFLRPLLSEGSVILIGRCPGQIVRWPSGSYPVGWHPIWILHMRRKGWLTFCGESVAESEPSPECAGERKQVALWKDIIWHRKHRIAAPEAGPLRDLWLRYQGVADSV